MSKKEPDQRPLPHLKYLDAQQVAAGDIEEWLDRCFAIKRVDSDPNGPMAITASVALHMIICQLAEVYPATTRQNPDGSAWDGLVLPARVLAFSRNANRDQMDMARGNLLDIACEHGATDDAIKMLVASGFDPTRFSRRVGMTPIGKCAFDGHVSALRLFAQAGFDLTLRMDREHTHQRDLVGSTILHRIMPLQGPGNPQGVEVVQALLDAGVDPMIENGEGRTAFEMAEGNIRVAMEKWLAIHQAQTMRDTVDHPKVSNEIPKPRL